MSTGGSTAARGAGTQFSNEEELTTGTAEPHEEITNPVAEMALPRQRVLRGPFCDDILEEASETSRQRLPLRWAGPMRKKP